jgi:hypothetical protein
MKPSQVTRNNHYVPQWYQRGFLQPKQAKLYALDLLADPSKNGVSEASPKRLFCEVDLYTTRFGNVLNDEIERLLFGSIDKSGCEAVRALIADDLLRMHRYFQALYEYLDAQKLRTPKGLDWIHDRYGQLSQIDLMLEMQSLRYTHCGIWTEGVREVVSAKDSAIKFLVSDHPVTIYHREFPPEAGECAYPSDPGIALVGSQTIFPLDANHCFILTNLEYAQAPNEADVFRLRTNARYRSRSMARTDAYIRTRSLRGEEVNAINLVLKSRARRYIAAGNAEWLYPERTNTFTWKQIAEILLPRDEVWRFGGEIFVGFKDGSVVYQDAFGRATRSHEVFAKAPPEVEPAHDDVCPCGSGRNYERCCQGMSIRERPSWTSPSVRERNIALCRAIHHLLGFDDGKDWDDIRRELSSDQVRRLHEVFETFWPTDTLLREILPRPDNRILRGVFLGPLDPRTLPLLATAWLRFFDELVLPHPFLNAATIKPEFSPTKNPAQYKEQTLRNVLSVLQLEEYIYAGKVHLVPDPGDLDPAFREETWKIAEQGKEGFAFSAADKRALRRLSRDESKRLQLRGAYPNFDEMVKRLVPDIAPELVPSVAEAMQRQFESDPLALLQPVEVGEGNVQTLGMKCFNTETGLFLASLTGSFVYCDMDLVWSKLRNQAGVPLAENQDWKPIAQAIENVEFALLVPPPDDEVSAAVRERANTLRLIAEAARDGRPTKLAQVHERLIKLADEESSTSEEHSAMTAHLEISVPAKGYLGRETIRLIHTYGLPSKIAPVNLALLVRLHAGEADDDHWSGEG